MRRPRFTIRTLLIAVAIAGLICGGVVMWQREMVFRKEARYHARLVEIDQAVLVSLSKDDALYRQTIAELLVQKAPGYRIFVRNLEADLVGNSQTAKLCRRKLGYHRELHLKYERAARFPWLPVAPDPPEPHMPE